MTGSRTFKIVPAFSLTFVSVLFVGCASLEQCSSGLGDAITSGDALSTIMGVVFVPLLPICTGMTALQDIDESSRQALPDSTQAAVSMANATAHLSHSQGSDDGYQSLTPEIKSRSSPSKTYPEFKTKDATHCVEIVPEGFKCNGAKRNITNVCDYKISARWRVNGDSWMQADFLPNQCRSVNSIFDEGGAIDYQACSWDRNASYGPYMEPCRY